MEKIKFHLENNRIVEVLATPVFNESEEIDGIVIRVDDITDRAVSYTHLKLPTIYSV